MFKMFEWFCITSKFKKKNEYLQIVFELLYEL